MKLIDHAAAVPLPLAVSVAAGSALMLLLLALALLLRQRRLKVALAGAESRIGFERSMRDIAERALADAHVTLYRLVAQQEDIRENERRRIARDVHDDLGQNLLALKIDVAQLRAGTGASSPVIRQKLDTIARNLDTTIASLRAIINDLRPSALEAGLRCAVEAQLAEFTRMSGVRHVLVAGADDLDAGADKSLEAMLFRILQEALTNVARHAHARLVTVTLARSADALAMRVEDDGIGIAPGDGAQGCGLRGMRDRVSAVGGEFSVGARAGGGTVLALSFPFAPQARRA